MVAIESTLTKEQIIFLKRLSVEPKTHKKHTIATLLAGPVALKHGTHETHFTRNRCCGGDESPDVARVFCANDHGAQISG